MTLEEAAAQLYALPREEFTAARNRLAKDTGDKELAAAIRALGKPSTAAWAVNQLVRARPAEIDTLLELGQSMRAAQEVLSVEDLRRLSAERGRVVAALARQTRDLTAVSDAAVAEVEETLRAAVADPAAGSAVREGRLTESLSYAGLGDLPTRPMPRPSTPDRTAIAEAEQAYEAATAARDAARERLAAVAEERSAAADRVAQLRTQLREAEAADARLATDVRDAERAEAAATRMAGAAEQQLRRAQPQQ